MKRLLILSAYAGTGHIRAAQALKAAADEEYTDLLSANYDALDFTTKFFKTVYGESYIFMVNHTPSLWGLLYQNMEKSSERKKLKKVVNLYDKVAYKGLRNLVAEFDPDAVLCTHFLPANVILARDGGPPVAVVVTDFDAHTFWVNEKVSRYFVASEEVAWQLRKYRIAPDRITVAGIPIHPRFSRRKGRAAAAKIVGIDEKKKTLLIVSSGFGGGDMETMVERILATPSDFQLVVITGRNEKMREKIARMIRGERRTAKVFGFVDNIEDFMESADLAVTKAGGLTTSECLARGVPMIIFSPIPGQEERNCDYLLENGAAVKAKNLDLLDFKIGQIFDDDARLSGMKAAAQKLSKPRAAFDIIDAVSGMSRKGSRS